MSNQSITRMVKHICEFNQQYRSITSSEGRIAFSSCCCHKKTNMECWRILFVERTQNCEYDDGASAGGFFLFVWLALEARISNHGNGKRAKSEAPVPQLPKSHSKGSKYKGSDKSSRLLQETRFSSSTYLHKPEECVTKFLKEQVSEKTR